MVHPAGRGPARLALPSCRDTPLTVGYLATLAATAWLLRWAGAPAARRLTASVSTDVAHLRRDPVTALAGSALVADQPWVSCAALFSVSVAPLEREVGSLRTAAVFAAGHVVATLATELPLAAAIRLGLAPASAARRLDVGVSYGAYACAGAAAGLLAPPGRRRAMALAAATTTLPALFGRRDLVAGLGHPIALAVGALCGRALPRTARART